MTSSPPRIFDRQAAIVQVAMDEEAAPFLAATDQACPSFTLGEAVFYPRLLSRKSADYPILLVRSKIGLVNAAAALSLALSFLESPTAVVSAGTAGGLGSDVQVGDLIIGTDYMYADADATAFGYDYGQVPGMPSRYNSDEALLEKAHQLASNYQGEGRALLGTMLAGGSFITARNVKDTREIFPQALSIDMETTALAQICSSWSIPFIAIRGISDLCGPAADQDFHMDAPIVADRSAQLSLTFLTL